MNQVPVFKEWYLVFNSDNWCKVEICFVKIFIFFSPQGNSRLDKWFPNPLKQKATKWATAPKFMFFISRYLIILFHAMGKVHCQLGPHDESSLSKCSPKTKLTPGKKKTRIPIHQSYNRCFCSWSAGTVICMQPPLKSNIPFVLNEMGGVYKLHRDCVLTSMNIPYKVPHNTFGLDK